MIKIWQRYFIKEVLKVFFLIIVCFFGVYVLIDYASHPNLHHHHSSNPWKELFHYYKAELVQRIDVLIPFALLIATIRTLSYLRSRNELTAFLVGGIKLHTLLRPFVIVGIFFTGFIYLNLEYFIPNALTELRHLHDKRALEKIKKNKNMAARHVALQDGTFLLFQDYNSAEKVFFDAFWIKSIDDIYRIKYLHPYEAVPTGYFVEHFSRNSNGELSMNQAFDTKEIPDLHFNKEILLDTATSPEELSLSTLWSKHSENSNKIRGEKEASMDAVFYRKLAIPWFCLLAVIAPIPFCIRFSRDQSTFLVYASCIFGLLACFLIIDAAWILAERQVVAPVWAIGVPFFLIMTPPIARFGFLK